MSNFDYNLKLLKVRKADGSETTVSLPLAEHMALYLALPIKAARCATLHEASKAFDAAHAGAPRTRAVNRSAYVRKALAARKLLG